jgi:hypothetical protein
MPPVVWIEQFAQAIITDSDIRGDERLDSFSSAADENTEFSVPVAGNIEDSKASNARQRRGFAGETHNEVLHRATRSLDFDRHARTGINNGSS